MKILLATPLLSPDIGGPATYAKILFDELPKQNITITTAYFGEIRHLPKIIRHIAYFYLVLKKTRGVDVVYALDAVSVGLPARMAAFLSSKKFLIRIAGDYAWEQGVQRLGVVDNLDDFSKQSGYGLQVSLFKFIQFVVAITADKVIVPSNYFKGIVMNWGVPSEKIKVIYSVFGLPESTITKQTCRDELGVHGVLLLSAGRLVPWKGFGMLIELVSELKNKYPEVKLLIAGSGPEQKALEALISKLNLGQYVVLLGQISQQKLGMYIKASDVFLLNTSYEGFSHQLLEVMGVGTPIITTPIGGNIELITDEVSGLFAQPDDTLVWVEKIESIVGDSIYAEKLVSGARAQVASFTIERMIEELVAELQKIKK